LPTLFCFLFRPCYCRPPFLLCLFARSFCGSQFSLPSLLSRLLARLLLFQSRRFLYSSRSYRFCGGKLGFPGCL
jgi:hypothetical protein